VKRKSRHCRYLYPASFFIFAVKAITPKTNKKASETVLARRCDEDNTFKYGEEQQRRQQALLFVY